jgi:hypothetical protein
MGAGSVRIVLELERTAFITSNTTDGMRVGAIRRTAHVSKREFCKDTVGQNNDVALGCQEMSGPPRTLDNPPFRAVDEVYPLSKLIGTTKCQSNAGEDIAKRILKCKAEDDCDNA